MALCARHGEAGSGQRIDNTQRALPAGGVNIRSNSRAARLPLTRPLHLRRKEQASCIHGPGTFYPDHRLVPGHCYRRGADAGPGSPDGMAVALTRPVIVTAPKPRGHAACPMVRDAAISAHHGKPPPAGTNYQPMNTQGAGTRQAICSRSWCAGRLVIDRPRRLSSPVWNRFPSCRPVSRRARVASTLSRPASVPLSPRREGRATTHPQGWPTSGRNHRPTSSEWWTASNQNAGRDQFRTLDAISSERLDGLHQNPHTNGRLVRGTSAHAEKQYGR